MTAFILAANREDRHKPSPTTFIRGVEVAHGVTRLAVVGLGPVGLATAIAFVMADHRVVGLDVDAGRVSRVARGEPPFYEAGLQDALLKVLSTRRFAATSDVREALAGVDIVFLCVGTPSGPDGSMDDVFLKEAAEDISRVISDDPRPIIVVKSTVVPGTTEKVVRPILEASDKRFGLGVNPEFLREGHALEDTLHPDRIVLGVDGPDTAKRLRALYAHVACPIVETDLTTAEAIKYATNAFLATKVAFANDLANLCQTFGISYDEVIQAVALDPRVNSRFLVPGVGFGGSCFPKDVRALV
ncbi:MAG: nucleotide sugar dehydrogenase, partial [Candidatus Methylomirabilales bacterium]